MPALGVGNIMSQFLEELIKLLGGFAIFAGALAWLIKSIITHFLSKDVEKYKSRLSAEAAREIEQFKNQLQMVALEHEVRFSKLHEKRAEIIADFWGLLYEADMSVRTLEVRIKEKHTESVVVAAAKQAHEACKDAFKFYEKNRLYFSKDLSDKIHRILSTMELTAAAYPYAEVRTSALEIWDKQSRQIMSIMDDVEHEFRVMLGAEKTDPKQTSSSNKAAKE
jgi:hypothetical protein